MEKKQYSGCSLGFVAVLSLSLILLILKLMGGGGSTGNRFNHYFLNLAILRSISTINFASSRKNAGVT